MLDIHITIELQPSPQLLQLLEALLPRRQPREPGPTMPSMGETERLLHPGPTAPQTKPQEVWEEPKDPALNPHEPPKWDPIIEIPKFPISDCTTPEHVTVQGMSPHLEYTETDDRRLHIRYISGNVWTIWDDILSLERSIPAKQKAFRKILVRSDVGNRRSAVISMIKAIRAGLRPGQAKELYEKMKGGAVTNNKFWTGHGQGPGSQTSKSDPDTIEAPFRKGAAPGDQVTGPADANDPDADFRPMLNQNTRIPEDGSKLEGSLED